MTDDQKALAYYKIGAQQRTKDVKPPYVPSRVRIARRVSGDFPFRYLFVEPGDYDCMSNQYGAVSVKTANGEMLGLRLDEFEPLAWIENEAAEAVRQ